MKRLRRDKLGFAATSSTGNSVRTSSRQSSRQTWPRGASALLATAMLLLAFAPFQSANAESLGKLNAQWAQISSSLVASLGATDEAHRAQGEQLWRWMQTRAASLNKTQTLSPRQVAALLDEWRHTQIAANGRGKIVVPKLAFGSKHRQSSTRLRATAFLSLLSPSHIVAPPRHYAHLTLLSSSHAAAKLSGVRSNRRHE